jgi:hypothetical protein
MSGIEQAALAIKWAIVGSVVEILYKNWPAEGFSQVAEAPMV